MTRALTLSLLAVFVVLALAVLPGAQEPDTAAAPADPGRDRSPGRAEVPGRYIVTYNRAVESPGAETESRERRQGFEAEHVYRRAVEGFAAELSPRQVERLEGDPEVAAVTPDRRVELTAELAPGEPMPPPGLRRTGTASKTDVRGRSGARVAVIDTGVDLDHPDLDVESGRNCVSADAPAEDQNGHGTHVAGTIAAENDGAGVVGVAPGTKIVPVKVFGSRVGAVSDVICGIDWVTSTRTDGDPANDVDVANMSLSGVGTRVGSCADTSDPQHQAVCASTAAGVTNVAAAGNDEWDYDFAAEPNTPAAYPEVLTVTAIGDSDGQPGGAGGAPACDPSEPDDGVASFSNWAGSAAARAHTVAAPGVCVRSSWLGGGGKTISGTSMATPHVTGAVALCLDEAGQPGPCAGLSPAQVVAKMRADALARAAADPGYGFAGSPMPGRSYGPLLWAGAAPSDSAAPRIEANSPARGQRGVPVRTAVSVTFDEYMDKPAAQAAFSLVRSGQTRRVAGSFSWRGHTMTFRPAAALSHAASYTASVSAAAKDAKGNPLEGGRSWAFRTLASRTAAPFAAVVEARRLTGGGASSLAADDNRFLTVASTPSGTRTSSWYGRFALVSNSLRSLAVTTRGRSSVRCAQTLSVFRWTTRRWVSLHSRPVGPTEAMVAKGVPGGVADYVSGTRGDGEVRVRARCTNPSSSFSTRNDLMKITYERP